MRFKAKINYYNLVNWLFMVAVFAYTGWPPRAINAIRTVMHDEQHRIPNEILGVLAILSFLAMPLILLLPYFKSIPEYYEVRENGLFVRQGWKKKLIPYTTIDSLLPLAPAIRWFPPANRILVILAKGVSFVVAPSDKERFLAEVSIRCPKLEKMETDFGLSLQQAIL
jgi:hypothetical protein